MLSTRNNLPASELWLLKTIYIYSFIFHIINFLYLLESEGEH